MLLRLKVERSMRSVERHQQVKGISILLLIQELDCEVAHGIRFEAVDLAAFSVDHKFGFALRARATGPAGQVSNAGRSLVIPSHVPLPAQAEMVSVARKNLAVGGVPFEPAAAGRAETVFGDQPVLHAVMRGQLAG